MYFTQVEMFPSPIKMYTHCCRHYLFMHSWEEETNQPVTIVYKMLSVAIIYFHFKSSLYICHSDSISLTSSVIRIIKVIYSVKITNLLLSLTRFNCNEYLSCLLLMHLHTLNRAPGKRIKTNCFKCL